MANGYIFQNKVLPLPPILWTRYDAVRKQCRKKKTICFLKNSDKLRSLLGLPCGVRKD